MFLHFNSVITRRGSCGVRPMKNGNVSGGHCQECTGARASLSMGASLSQWNGSIAARERSTCLSRAEQSKFRRCRGVQICTMSVALTPRHNTDNLAVPCNQPRKTCETVLVVRGLRAKRLVAFLDVGSATHTQSFSSTWVQRQPKWPKRWATLKRLS
jgi:hypothetical protein